MDCNKYYLNFDVDTKENDNVLFKQLYGIKPCTSKRLIIKTQKKIDILKKRIKNIELLIKKQDEISQIDEIKRISFS